MKRLLPLPAVIDRTGLGRSSIYNRIKLGSFPAPISLGGSRGGHPCRVAFVEEEIEAWITERIAESRATKQVGTQPLSTAEASVLTMPDRTAEAMRNKRGRPKKLAI
jgi:prophage regulatory protein